MTRSCSLWLLSTALGLALLSGSSNRILAQSQTTQSATSEALALVPPDAIALVTVQPRLILKDEAFKLFPIEVASASAIDSVGIDPVLIERIDAIVGLPGPTGPQGAALVTFSSDVAASQIRPSVFREGPPGKQAGVELYVLKEGPDIVVHFRDARHVIIGTRNYVMRLLKSKLVDGELRRLAGRLGEPGHASVVIALEPMRDMLMAFAQAPQVPPPIAADVATLAGKTQMVALRMQVGTKPLTALALEAANETEVKAIEESWNRLLKFFLATVRQEMEKEASEDEGAVGQATVAYAQRLSAEIEKLLALTRHGNRLVLRIEADQQYMAHAGIMVGLLLPAVQAAREAARRVQSSNNLKQIVVAAHNYADVHRVFPNGGEPSTNSKSKLSWRVQLLPFIEQAPLYEQFHHDEPWDSAHNIKLLDRMPAIYKHPRSTAPVGMTVYQMSVGENLAGEAGKQLSLRDFTDGTSNTIFAVETTDEAAVPWTKPEDINPALKPEGLRMSAGNFLVALTDGSVRSFPVSIAPEQLRAMLTRNGGEIVQP